MQKTSVFREKSDIVFFVLWRRMNKTLSEWQYLATIISYDVFA